jgi:hypothetical protein
MANPVESKMASSALEEIQQDDLAMAVARALALANDVATGQGVDLAGSIVTITEESPPPARLWRIHYGPRDYRNRRGGDLIVVVDERAGVVQRILLGQ